MENADGHAQLEDAQLEDAIVIVRVQAYTAGAASC